jgi:hypothetical protein
MKDNGVGDFRMARLCRGLLLILFVAVTFFFPLSAPIPHRIDGVHRFLIERGMTEAEVEGIFGVPAGSYDGAIVEEDRLLGDSSLFLLKMVRNAHHCKVWSGRHGAVCICFDKQGRVLMLMSNHFKTRVVLPWERWWPTFLKS